MKTAAELEQVNWELRNFRSYFEFPEEMYALYEAIEDSKTSLYFECKGYLV